MDFYRNKISDIKVLENVKFEKLEKLDLRWNIIKDKSIIFKLKVKEIYL